MIRIIWCQFEICYHNFEKIIKIGVDFVLFSEICNFLYLFFYLIEKAKAVEVCQTLLE